MRTALIALLPGWLALASLSTLAGEVAGPYPVGMRQVAYADARGGDRTIAMAVFYPTKVEEASDDLFVMPFYANLHLHKDAATADDGTKRPLILLSHGRGSNGLVYAWFAEFLASHGYIVAALDHYRANSYDATIAYLANKIWQRPVDVGLAIGYLLEDETWGGLIDASRIGVAGHSQGGFTALWVGGARINPDNFLAFQRRWRDNPMVPEYLRRDLPVDAAPALDVRDERVKAVFAMAPGLIQAFGMDAAGLQQLSVPTYIIVGAADTVTPPDENAELAARSVPGARLEIIPGPVGHEIFVNECNEEGRNDFPESCIDEPGVDRAGLHQSIGNAALTFFDTALEVSRPN